MARRVVITGIGWVTPLGHEIESVWRRILAGESGVASTTLFDASTFPTRFSAEVKNFALADFLGDDAARHKRASRNTQFALAAASMAWKSARLADCMALDSTRVGVYLGGGEGPADFIPSVTAAIAGCRGPDGKLTSLDFVRWTKTALEVFDATSEMEQEPNLAGGHLAVQFNAQGPNLNTLTACAASTQAIGEAMHVIRYGDADVILSGGTHSMIHPLGITGFSRLTTLSTRNDACQTASRPFDRTRDGFVLGEGAGVLIVEELEHARWRGAPILAEIVGYGSTADAFRITDVHENGRGATAAMRAALAAADLTPAHIDYISAHGTGTQENDAVETLAIRNVFGDRAKDIPVSSVKSMIGHLIAAAGAVELITCILAIRDGMAPPTINYTTADPKCDLDYVPNQSRRMTIHAVLSNSFGFGGQNTTLVVRAMQD